MGKNRSATVGLDEIVYSKYDPITGTVGSFNKFAKGIDCAITTTSNSVTIHADDGASLTYYSEGESTLAFVVQDLEPELIADLRGKKIDDNGVIIGGKDTLPPQLVVAFRAKKANGGYRYKVFYNCKAGEPEEKYHTIEGGTVTVQTPTISLTAINREKDGIKEATYDSDMPNAVQSVMDDWFIKPYEPKFAAAPATLQPITLSSVSGVAGGDTTVTATPATPIGMSAHYQTAASVVLPSLDDVVSGAPWSPFVDGNDYTASGGDDFAVVYTDSSNKVKYAGKTIVVI